MKLVFLKSWAQWKKYTSSPDIASSLDSMAAPWVYPENNQNLNEEYEFFLSSVSP